MNEVWIKKNWKNYNITGDLFKLSLQERKSEIYNQENKYYEEQCKLIYAWLTLKATARAMFLYYLKLRETAICTSKLYKGGKRGYVKNSNVFFFKKKVFFIWL